MGQARYGLAMPRDMWQKCLEISRSTPSPNNDTNLNTLFLLLETSVPVLFLSLDFNLFHSVVILRIYLWHRGLSVGSPYYNFVPTNDLFYSRFITRNCLPIPQVSLGMSTVRLLSLDSSQNPVILALQIITTYFFGPLAVCEKCSRCWAMLSGGVLLLRFVWGSIWERVIVVGGRTRVLLDQRKVFLYP